jgi:biopolymer transport protein ExbB/TolQ
MSVEEVIFDVAEALRYPVLILALAGLGLVLVEAGAFAVEIVQRRRRDTVRLERVAEAARSALDGGDVKAARTALREVAWSGAMASTLELIAERVRARGGADRVAKALADFDFTSLRRLERTRVLVRAGPALGLMGTLIPLAPALAGLAEGDVDKLSRNLRVAFSVTVLGLLVGAVAFAISLVRDRLYGQDLSDLEFVVATLEQRS